MAEESANKRVKQTTSASGSVSGLSEVPASVMVYICSFLRPENLARLELACCSFRVIIGTKVFPEQLKQFYSKSFLEKFHSVVQFINPAFTLRFLHRRRKRLALGVGHSLVLTSKGKIFSFGDGSYGALGHGDRSNQVVPKRIASLDEENIVSLSAGVFHSVALSQNGDVYTFGEGSFGRLGHGKVDEEIFSPKRVAALQGEGACAIAAGCNHCLVLTQSGKVFSFGKGINGRLGSSNTHIKFKPEVVKRLLRCRVIAIAAGAAHSLVLTNEMEVLSFGMGRFGRLGHGDEADQTKPTTITTLNRKNVIGIGAGGNYSFVFTYDGHLYTFGHNGNGKLGHACAQQNQHFLAPKLLDTIRNEHFIVDCAAGESHTIALTKAGKVLTFGSGRYGKLGHGDDRDQCYPKVVTGLENLKITSVAAGDWHSMALTENGDVYSWGGGWFHRLGHENNQNNQYVPKLVAALIDS